MQEGMKQRQESAGQGQWRLGRLVGCWDWCWGWGSGGSSKGGDSGGLKSDSNPGQAGDRRLCLPQLTGVKDTGGH